MAAHTKSHAEALAVGLELGTTSVAKTPPKAQDEQLALVRSWIVAGPPRVEALRALGAAATKRCVAALGRDPSLGSMVAWTAVWIEAFGGNPVQVQIDLLPRWRQQVVSLGDREIELRLTGDLEVGVFDAEGQAIRWPTQRKSDDPAIYAQAKAIRNAVQKVFAEAAAALRGLARQCMLDGLQGRSLLDGLRADPAWAAFAGRWVWGHYDTRKRKLLKSFTLVDGQPVDVKGHSVEVRDNIGIVHPAEWTENELKTWRERLPGGEAWQLERPIFRAARGWSGAVPSGTAFELSSLVADGWRPKSPDWDHKIILSLTRRTRGVTFTIEIESISALVDPKSPLNIEVKRIDCGAAEGGPLLLADGLAGLDLSQRPPAVQAVVAPTPTPTQTKPEVAESRDMLALLCSEIRAEQESGRAIAASVGVDPTKLLQEPLFQMLCSCRTMQVARAAVLAKDFRINLGKLLASRGLEPFQLTSANSFGGLSNLSVSFRSKQSPVGLDALLPLAARLESLTLIDGVIKDLSALVTFTRLRAVHLPSQELDETSLETLRKMPWLESIDLSHNPLRCVRALSGMPALKVLTLNAGRYSPRYFNYAPKLYPLLDGLDDLPALKALSLEGHPIGSIEVLGLSRFPSLKELSLCRTEVHDLSPLRDLPKLRKLDCSHSYVSDLSPVLDLPELEYLRCEIPRDSERYVPMSRQVRDLRDLLPHLKVVF